MMLKLKFKSLSLFMAGVAWVCGSGTVVAQSVTSQSGAISLNDLSAFQNPGKTWQIVGDVRADLNKANVLKTDKGTGILVNLPSKRNHGQDLLTNFEHGDLDLELDYMMAKGSNSGVYLQGRYEVQLLDSWGATTPKAGDNGGIYERWDESKPEGQKGYQGYPPRQNASRAPGLWQNLKISFQAPRFDASGKKIENAKIIRAELNGVTIHEDVELLGPTRGAMGTGEVAMGPLRFQGDHGALAIRNIKVTNFDKPRPELVDLKYTVYKGRFDKADADYSKTPPEAAGPAGTLTTTVTRIPNEFLIRYTGTLRVKEPGEYSFNMNAAGGGSVMKINNQSVVPVGARTGKVTLPAGDLPFDLVYSKFEQRARPSLGLAVSGPGIREFMLGDVPESNNPVDPILVDAPVTTTLRSFMDLPNDIRVTHAISVGSPEQVHYTYDLDKGMVVQAWRGRFLDATPMWHSRGDGSSRPVGAVQHFGNPVFTLAKLPSPQSAWVTDTAGSGYRPKGYVLDAGNRPTFKYQIYGANVSDAIQVLDNGHGLRRELTVQNPSGEMYARLAEGETIEETGKNMYLVDGKSYYLRLDDAGGAKPVVREANGRKELVVPVQGKLSYSILF
jgi:hypothetical protein